MAQPEEEAQGEETESTEAMVEEPAKETGQTVTVHVIVVSARNLAQMDRGGKADPYVVLRCGDEEQKTAVVKKSLAPEWTDARFQFLGVPSGAVLRVEMFDWDRGSQDDPMGSVSLPLRSMDSAKRWFELEPMPGCEQPQGELQMMCTVLDPSAGEGDDKAEEEEEEEEEEGAMLQAEEEGPAREAAAEEAAAAKLAAEEDAARVLVQAETEKVTEDDESESEEEEGEEEEDEEEQADDDEDGNEEEEESSEEGSSEEEESSEDEDAELGSEPSEAPAKAGAASVQFGGKKKFTPLHLELQGQGQLVLREPEGRSALREATAVGCAVAELKNSRKGHPFAFRVDLAKEDSGGDSKYVVSVESEKDKAEWMRCLAAAAAKGQEPGRQGPTAGGPPSPSRRELKAARKSQKLAVKQEKKANKTEAKQEKSAAKQERKMYKQEAKQEKKQQKTDAKLEKKQGKLDAKQAKRDAKQDKKQAKRDAKDAKKAAKTERKATKKGK